MLEILNILKKIDFPKNAITQDDLEHQKYEMLGDSLIKVYVVEKLFHFDSARDISRENSRLLSNKSLEKIFDSLMLNDLWFNTKVESGKAKSDIIEMVVGKAYQRFGVEYAKEVMSYLFDVEIYDANLRNKSRATITSNFSTAWGKMFGKVPPNFVFDRVGESIHAKLMIGASVLIDKNPSRKHWFEIDQDIKMEFVEDARAKGITC